MDIDNIYQLIGYDNLRLEWWQMGIRAFIIFFYSVLMVRLSNKRIFGKQTAFDIVLGIVLGSIFSRAITGNADFFPTLFAGLVLVVLHRFLGFLAVSSSFGPMVKGNPKLIVEDGKFNELQMKFSSLTKKDILEALRLQTGIEDLDKVKRAYLERSGDISFILEKN